MIYRRVDTCENWAQLVRQLLCSLGFYNVWLAQGVSNVHIFLALCKQRLRDQFLQEWNGDINNKSFTSFYSAVKGEFCYSDYLSILNIPKYRYSIITFISGNHKLPIATGRWAGIPKNERLCRTCNVLGDEFHLVFYCQKGNLSALRRQYIPQYFLKHPSMFKFQQLINSKDVKVIRSLSVFIYKSMLVNNS